MAKRSEIIGEYILTINDNNSVNVSFVPDNTKKELLAICEAKGITPSPGLTTHQLGNLLFKELGKRGDKELVFDEYEIKKDENGRINVLKSFANTKEGLRIISEKVGFKYDKAWDTQHFGRQLLNFIESGQQPEIKRKDTKPEEKTEESTSQENGDNPNLIKINLVATQQTCYHEAEEESEEWGEGGVFIISSTPTRDIEDNPFEYISFLSADLETASYQLWNFHQQLWDECEDVLPGAYVLFQDTPQNFEDTNWNNVAKALSIIFKPEYSLIDSKDIYEGPETIFEFKVYNFGDYDKWSKVWRDNAKPFYTGRYRIFKNDDGEWVGEKLED